MYSSYCRIPFSAGTICLPYVIRTYRSSFRSSSKLPCYEMLTTTNKNQVSWPINYRYIPLFMCADTLEIDFYCSKGLRSLCSSARQRNKLWKLAFDSNMCDMRIGSFQKPFVSPPKSTVIPAMVQRLRFSCATKCGVSMKRTIKM